MQVLRQQPVDHNKKQSEILRLCDRFVEINCSGSDFFKQAAPQNSYIQKEYQTFKALHQDRSLNTKEEPNSFANERNYQASSYINQKIGKQEYVEQIDMNLRLQPSNTLDIPQDAFKKACFGKKRNSFLNQDGKAIDVSPINSPFPISNSNDNSKKSKNDQQPGKSDQFSTFSNMSGKILGDNQKQGSTESTPSTAAQTSNISTNVNSELTKEGQVSIEIENLKIKALKFKDIYQKEEEASISTFSNKQHIPISPFMNNGNQIKNNINIICNAPLILPFGSPESPKQNSFPVDANLKNLPLLDGNSKQGGRGIKNPTNFKNNYLQSTNQATNSPVEIQRNNLISPIIQQDKRTQLYQDNQQGDTYLIQNTKYIGSNEQEFPSSIKFETENIPKLTTERSNENNEFKNKKVLYMTKLLETFLNNNSVALKSLSE